MKTITFNGKSYESRRYTLEELKNLFNGYVLVLEDATFEDMNLIDGILIEICETRTKREVMRKYALEEKSCTFWDLSPEPILIPYMELIQE